MTASTPAPGRIFISYRREETAYPAGWLFDRLDDHFGAGQIFKDVDSIQLGDDFVEVITTAVASCDVLLALIGDQWLTITDERGRRRLDNPHDFVRLEIEAALKRKVRVIPVLVAGARMPRADELPPSLARLVRRQALELSPSRFDFDTSRLLKVLDRTLAQAQAPPTAAGPGVTAPAGHDAGTRPGSVPVEAGGDAAAASASSVEPSGPGTADAGERPDAGEHPSRGRAPGIPPAGSAPPMARTPADAGKPPDRQRRRIPARAAVLTGAGAGIALIVVLIVTLASSHSTPPPAGAANPTSSPKVIFTDDFSSQVNAWTATANAAGHYKNGAYRLYLKSANASGGAAPLNVHSVYPSAPPKLRISVDARRLTGGQHSGYGIACRASHNANSFYAFMIWGKDIQIAKFLDHAPWVIPLKDVVFDALNVNAKNRLQAVCTSEQGQQAVHLVFSVNGRVIKATDTKAPFQAGTVGLLVGTDPDAKTPTEAEFDNFAVTQL
jgi:hypothetical protein